MPADQRSFTATEIRAGVMVLASLVVLIGFVAAIRGCGSGAGEPNRFIADFTRINGLNLGAEVRFGGVKSGKVVEIGTDPDDRSRIRVVAEVPADVPVNHDSVASIEQVSLTTGKHLEISTGSAEAALHVSGDRIASVTTDGGLFDVPDLEGVVTRLETTLDGVIALLGVDRARAEAATTGEEMVDLAAVTAALERTLDAGTSAATTLDATIADNRAELAAVIARLAELEAAAAELLANLNAAVEENREPLRETVGNLAELTETAARRIDELSASLERTLEHLERLGGDTAGLLDEQRPTLELILRNLEATTRNLRTLSQTLADQPGSLVYGATPRGREGGGK
ncbi:MAG: MlaD family protein [Thermoanaerobaculales bacterium]|nr:MlaD family protein [Thermoanaerobaculales bacterium]